MRKLLDSRLLHQKQKREPREEFGSVSRRFFNANLGRSRFYQMTNSFYSLWKENQKWEDLWDAKGEITPP
jgi:hypothetical protein